MVLSREMIIIILQKTLPSFRMQPLLVADCTFCTYGSPGKSLLDFPEILWSAQKGYVSGWEYVCMRMLSETQTDCLMSPTGNDSRVRHRGGFACCRLLGCSHNHKGWEFGENCLQCGRCSCIWGEHFFRPSWTNKQFNFFIVLINLIKLTSKVC